MPLLTIQINTVLKTGGFIEFTTALAGANNPLISGGMGGDLVVDRNYTKCNLTVSTADNKIIMNRVANDSTTNNAVNIRTIDTQATVGSITGSGYVYTGDFSGCVFYLYRTGPDEITGVHAYSGAQAVATTKGFFRKKTVNNMVVREFGPQDYYTRNPATQLLRYPTRGELDLSTGEQSLGFLSCVERNTAITYLFSVAGAAGGYRVKRLIRTYRADY